jgi:carbonic anhydrase
VICFELDGLFLPAFSLRPENIWHKVRSWLGYQDIDFEGYPTFSARYLLRGADEEAIRAVFTDRILGFYEATAGLCTEGNEDRLLFYRQPVRVKPEDVRAFVEEGLEGLSRFCPWASSGT